MGSNATRPGGTAGPRREVCASEQPAPPPDNLYHRPDQTRGLAAFKFNRRCYQGLRSGDADWQLISKDNTVARAAPESDDKLLAIHRTVLSLDGGGKAPVDPHQAAGQVAWAALSTSGLRALKLPVDVRDVIVLADGDEPGEAAARDCARRWKREGRRVRIARPPKGMDVNDLLVGGAPSPMRGAR